MLVLVLFCFACFLLLLFSGVFVLIVVSGGLRFVIPICVFGVCGLRVF